MTQADEKRITVRYKAIDEEAIERVKALTQNETSSKAILKVVHLYPAMFGRVADQAAQIEELKRNSAIAGGCCRTTLNHLINCMGWLTSWLMIAWEMTGSCGAAWI